jgi:transposase|tara:strand:- start:3278 stop:3904 length:627 start_codon:yes stop_codon:yes gene_type:complete
MPKAKPLSKELIMAAVNKTKSNRAAARYLNVSYIHYKKWAKLYESKTHDNLFEQHKNQSGKGIPKFLKNKGKEPALIDIIEGRVDVSSFSPDKLKYRLITEGYLLEECASCGFHERRVLDYKMPLLLHFKDGNKKNYRKENTELLCYNHFFLTVGDIFSNKQLKGIEDHVPVNQGDVEWELDEYQKQRLTELGLHNEKDDGLDLISRI